MRISPIVSLVFAGTLVWACGSQFVFSKSDLSSSPLSAREGVSMVVNGDHISVVGGFEGNRESGVTLFDGATYSLVDDQWQLIADLPIAPRWGHAASPVSDGMFVWGGSSQAEGGPDLLDGAIYSHSNNRWKTITPSSGLPQGGRLGTAAETIGSDIIIGGGASWGSNLQHTLSVYSLTQDKWGSVPLQGNFVDMLSWGPGMGVVVLTADDEWIRLSWLDAETLDVLGRQRCRFGL